LLSGAARRKKVVVPNFSPVKTIVDSMLCKSLPMAGQRDFSVDMTTP
jgi:hypothetical protein